jgi:hypothetical protein|tara:strand:- start:408 stop:587 length:180 start_codon:yes stop_codon:yes gene_type:complete
MNLTKHESSSVEITGDWYGTDLYVKFTRTDKDLGISHFEITLDDIDLEHFISTLIEFQR